MLTKLKVKKFKSLYDVEISLKKLNIFIGPNNSGKSSILQVLLFLKQCYEHKNPKYDHPYNFREFNEVVFDKKVEDIIHIFIEQELTKKLNEKFTTLGYDLNKIGTDFQIPNNANKLVIDSRLMDEFFESGLILYKNTLPENHPYFEEIRKKIDPKLIAGGTSDGDRWLRFSRSIKYHDEAQSHLDQFRVIKALNESIINLNSFYSNFFKNITFIPVERGSMKWFTQIVGSTPKEIHTNDKGSTLFNALFHMIRREHSKTLKRIRKWTKEFGIHDLTPYPVDATEPSCGVETLQDYSSSPFQLISMGFGTRQVLFVIVKALLAKKRSLILIEEPEIHLHPSYQTKIIDFFVELINNDDKQVMVTTHSEYLLLRIQNSILRGEIDKESVGIFYIDIKDGKTKVNELQFTKEGSFEMPGFYDVTQQEYREWLQLKAKNSDK
ncbi:MAG: AAA family ATPase [Promethearchaeota archaeon]